MSQPGEQGAEFKGESGSNYQAFTQAIEQINPSGSNLPTVRGELSTAVAINETDTYRRLLEGIGFGFEDATFQDLYKSHAVMLFAIGGNASSRLSSAWNVQNYEQPETLATQDILAARLNAVQEEVTNVTVNSLPIIVDHVGRKLVDDIRESSFYDALDIARLMIQVSASSGEGSVQDATTSSLLLNEDEVRLAMVDLGAKLNYDYEREVYAFAEKDFTRNRQADSGSQDSPVRLRRLTQAVLGAHFVWKLSQFDSQMVRIANGSENYPNNMSRVTEARVGDFIATSMDEFNATKAKEGYYVALAKLAFKIYKDIYELRKGVMEHDNLPSVSTIKELPRVTFTKSLRDIVGRYLDIFRYRKEFNIEEESDTEV